jgi:hypothetical protein
MVDVSRQRTDRSPRGVLSSAGQPPSDEDPDEESHSPDLQAHLQREPQQDHLGMPGRTRGRSLMLRALVLTLPVTIALLAFTLEIFGLLVRLFHG